MKAIGYIRVSTDRQEIGPEVQSERIRAYCAMRGMTLTEVVIDIGVSGATPISQRPGGLVKKLESVSNVHLVALKLDRLFRDAADCLEMTRKWENSGIVLHIVDMGGNSIDTTSAAGRFMLTVLAGAAEMERNLISERTSAALQMKKKNGQKTGGAIPWGFQCKVRDGKKILEPYGYETYIIAICKIHKSEGKSLAKIAETLSEKKYITRAGDFDWSADMVKRVLEADRCEN